MKRRMHILSVGCLCALTLALSQQIAQAQVINTPYNMALQNQLMRQGLANQALFAGQPGSYYGANYGPFYGGGGFNPYANSGYGSSPYTPGLGAYGAGAGIGNNPYTPAGGGYGLGSGYGYSGGLNSYNPYGIYNPYNYGAGGAGYGAGQVLMGSANVMQAYGTVITSQESARLLREQALQARLDTRKKAFELEMYIKANTPTYTQDQERIAKSTLRRIQTNSLPGEVTNGKSLNFLLDDLRNFPNKKIALEPIHLSDNVLSHLNVTKNTLGLGLLRDDGRLTWPVALQERMSVKQRRDLDEQVKELVKGAYREQIDVNLLKDVRAEMDRIREDIVAKVNEIPTAQYLEAKRFLQEFYQSTVAVEKGEAPIQAKFQRYIDGGKSVQDVVDYLVQNGLRFGPATANDEAAYRAVHTAMAAFDVAMNSQLGENVRDR